MSHIASGAAQSAAIDTLAQARTREDLAALFRLVAHFRMTDLIDTHISARIPGTDDEFFINRYGVLFDEMRPEDLVRVDAKGHALETDADGELPNVNAAGFTIHSAVHSARPEVACVVHTHTGDGIAVAAQQRGLLPISQHALRFYNKVGYHDYEGIALELAERERLIRDLADHPVMILRNHGLLATGTTIQEAFVNIYFLERACQAQIKALAGGEPLTIPPPEVCARTAQQFMRPGMDTYNQRTWRAALRLLD